jgi:hypothetical protein
VAQREVEVQLYEYSSKTSVLEGGEWSASRPGRTLTPGKTRYPLHRRLGGPQGRSGRTENLAPPGFDPRTVQPAISHYTDWATRPSQTIHRTTQITTKLEECVPCLVFASFTLAFALQLREKQGNTSVTLRKTSCRPLILNIVDNYLMIGSFK